MIIIFISEHKKDSNTHGFEMSKNKFIDNESFNNYEVFNTKLLIASLVFSKMLYSSTVWSNTSTQNINKLQPIQKFASKIVMNSRKFDHVTPLLYQLKWLPVKQLLYYRDAVLTYKCFNGFARA